MRLCLECGVALAVGAHPNRRLCVGACTEIHAQKYFRERRLRKLDAILIHDRVRHHANRVERNQKRRIRYALNADVRLAAAERSKIWEKQNPVRVREHRIRTKAKRRAVIGEFTRLEWRNLVEFWSGCCAYCGMSDRPLGPDHRVPIAKGGTGFIENILPSCKSCNQRKSTKTEAEYRQVRLRECA